MKANEFKNFKEIIKNDLDYAEHLGFAFINLTDKQAVEVIKHYASIGETEIKILGQGKPYITFGKRRQFNFPLDKYMELLKR